MLPSGLRVLREGRGQPALAVQRRDLDGGQRGGDSEACPLRDHRLLQSKMNEGYDINQSRRHAWELRLTSFLGL